MLERTTSLKCANTIFAFMVILLLCPTTIAIHFEMFSFNVQMLFHQRSIVGIEDLASAVTPKGIP